MDCPLCGTKLPDDFCDVVYPDYDAPIANSAGIVDHAKKLFDLDSVHRTLDGDFRAGLRPGVTNYEELDRYARVLASVGRHLVRHTEQLTPIQPETEKEKPIEHTIEMAKALLEPGEELQNPEYVRAMIELCSDLTTLPRSCIAEDLGVNLDDVYAACLKQRNRRKEECKCADKDEHRRMRALVRIGSLVIEITASEKTAKNVFEDAIADMTRRSEINTIFLPNGWEWAVVDG